jgi:hypothetical protein
MRPNSKVATFTGEGMGRFGPMRSSSWHGFVFFNTSSKVKLSCLNNLIEAFEGEFDERELYSSFLGMVIIKFHFPFTGLFQIFKDRGFAPLD